MGLEYQFRGDVEDEELFSLTESRWRHVVACDPWPSPTRSIGDAFAWGEADIAFPERFRPLINDLTESRHSLDDLPRQLVHGPDNAIFLQSCRRWSST